MARPCISDHPLTATERSRRWRERVAAQQAELEQLRAVVAWYEALFGAAREQKPLDTDTHP